MTCCSDSKGEPDVIATGVKNEIFSCIGFDRVKRPERRQTQIITSNKQKKFRIEQVERLAVPDKVSKDSNNTAKEKPIRKGKVFFGEKSWRERVEYNS